MRKTYDIMKHKSGDLKLPKYPTERLVECSKCHKPLGQKYSSPAIKIEDSYCHKDC